MTPIYFYLPAKDWPSDMPNSADEFWEEFGRGIYCWTLQTYLHLRKNDYPCRLVDQLPQEGIVIAHRDSLPYELKPNSSTLLVCIKADRDPHPYAQVHLVQNPEECKTIKNSYYIPLWPQPGLIPREPARGHKVENVAYMGLRYNLAPELQSQQWVEGLKALGLNWQIRPRHLWHDYSDVDVVLAVREFGNSHQHLWKPATKLYNSWHAEVPAVLGCESAFRSEGKKEFDYFEVKTPEEAVRTLERLKETPQLYQRIIENGKIRSQEKTKERVKEVWKRILAQEIVPQYKAWNLSPRWKQDIYIKKCIANIRISGLKRRLPLSSRK